MSLAFTLKILCDLCFYSAFANFFSFLFGGQPAMQALPLFAACAYMSAVLSQKGGLRLLPLAALPAYFLIVPFNLANAALFLPSAAYLVYMAAGGRGEGSISAQEGAGNIFLFFLKIYFPFTVLMLIMGMRAAVESASLPYAFVFLISSVVLMRMLRHDAAVLSQTRFRIMNTCQVFAVVLLGAFLGSKSFLSLCGLALKTFYFRIIAPVLVFLFMGVMYLLWPLFYLLGKLPESEHEMPEINMQLGVPFEEEMGVPRSAGGDILKAFLYLAVIALAVYLVFMLFKKLSSYGAQTAGPPGAKERRYALDPGRKPVGQGIRIENQIRRVYRKFLGLCHKSGIEKLAYRTSADYERMMGARFASREEAARFRSLYIGARYGGKDALQQDTQEMKRIFASFKKE